MEEKGVEGVQAVTRPSLFVVAVKVKVELEVEEEEEGEGWRVRVTGMLAAGRPMVVSRTWHVIGGFAGVVVVVVIVVGVGVFVALGEERCERREVRRGVDVGIRL